LSWRPRIIAFFCKWCAGSAAETAGVMRLRYDPNIVPIIVPCTGRIDPQLVVSAFLNGADGVLIGGCHTPNDCHYSSGNFKAFKRVYMLRKMLSEVGVEPERVRLEWISATEAPKLARVVNEFVEEVRRLGPMGGSRA
jgi:F420-non-reducing hydrogenase iron-sulfur subunit